VAKAANERSEDYIKTLTQANRAIMFADDDPDDAARLLIYLMLPNPIAAIYDNLVSQAPTQARLAKGIINDNEIYR